jgi:hypothetical protein
MQSKPEIYHVVNEWHNQCGGVLSAKGSKSAPDLFSCGGDLETNLALLKGFIESQCGGVWSIPNLNVAGKSLWTILKWEKTPPNPRQAQIDATAAEEKRRVEDAQRRAEEDQRRAAQERNANNFYKREDPRKDPNQSANIAKQAEAAKTAVLNQQQAKAKREVEQVIDGVFVDTVGKVNWGRTHARRDELRKVVVYDADKTVDWVRTLPIVKAKRDEMERVTSAKAARL